MHLRWNAAVVLTGIVVLSLSRPAVFAQGQPDATAQPVGTTGTVGTAGSVGTTGAIDVSKLPINLQRISRNIQTTTVREQRSGLNLQYLIQVIAQIPSLVVFTKDDELAGLAPHGAPSHQEMIDQNTPIWYRERGADISGLFRWMIENGK